MRAYLRGLLEEEARRASNMALLRRLSALGEGYDAEQGEAAQEIDRIRAERDH